MKDERGLKEMRHGTGRTREERQREDDRLNRCGIQIWHPDLIDFAGPGHFSRNMAGSPRLKAGGLVFLVLYFLSWAETRAALARFEWIRTVEGSGFVVESGLAIDQRGSVYLTGYFKGELKLGGVTQTAEGEYDGFVAKFTSNGDFVWLRTLVGPGREFIECVATTPEGEVMVGGRYGAYANFLGQRIDGNGGMNRFMAKLSSEGERQWMKGSADAADNAALFVAVGNDGNIAVQWAGPNYYVTSLDPNGAERWTRSTTGGYRGLRIDSAGNVLSLGDRTIEKRSPSGSPVWERQLFAGALALSTDQEDNIYIGGQITDAVVVEGVTFSNGERFLRKLSAAGEPVWTKAGSVAYSAVMGLGFDAAGRLYVYGWEGASGLFLSEYSASGAERMLARWGHTQNYDFPEIGVEADGTCYIASTFGTTISIGEQIFVPNGESDGYLMKVEPYHGPEIFGQPRSQSILAGQTLNLEVTANIVGTPTYQWFRNGRPLDGETGRTISIANAQPIQSGNYTVVVGDGTNSTTSDAAEVVVHFAPTVEIVSPGDGSLTRTGSELVVEVNAADPDGPIRSVRLYANGNAVGMMTQGPFVFRFTPAIDGLVVFEAEVTDSNGYIARSSGVTVDAGTSPTLMRLPESISAPAGSTVTFSVGTRGTGPLSYQWHRDETPLTGMVSPTLAVSNVGAGEAGEYWARVENRFGQILTPRARLTIEARSGEFVEIFADGTRLSGNSQQFNGAVTLALAPYFSGGEVFYTLDGSAPSFASRRYEGPFTLVSPATLRTVAYSRDFRVSGERQATLFTIVPAYRIVATTRGGGSVLRDPGGETHVLGTALRLTAAPSEGWNFLRWTGHALSESRELSFLVERSLSVRAVFGTPVLSTVAGAGYLDFNQRAELYPHGTRLKVTAVPENGFYLALWGGSIAEAGSANPITVTITNARPQVAALFGQLAAGEACLTVVEKGGGKVARAPNQQVFRTPTNVTLTGVPDEGQKFVRWAGDITSTQNPVTFQLGGSKVVHAIFTEGPVLKLEPWSDANMLLSINGLVGQIVDVEISGTLGEWAFLERIENTVGEIYQTQYLIGEPRRFFRAKVAQEAAGN